MEMGYVSGVSVLPCRSFCFLARSSSQKTTAFSSHRPTTLVFTTSWLHQLFFQPHPKATTSSRQFSTLTHSKSCSQERELLSAAPTGKPCIIASSSDKREVDAAAKNIKTPTSDKSPTVARTTAQADGRKKKKAWASAKFSEIVEEAASFLGPREKGDLRDVVLMSLSFAVLVYISQKLVWAYCLLRHISLPH